MKEQVSEWPQRTSLFVICITSYHPLERVLEWSLVGTDQKEDWEENGLIKAGGQAREENSVTSFYTVKEVGKETEVLNLEAEGVLSSFYSTLQ